MRLKARVKEAKAFRAAQIQKLRGALLDNDAASFLCQPEGSAAEISQRQGARATTQCWVVLKTYEEIDRMSSVRHFCCYFYVFHSLFLENFL